MKSTSARNKKDVLSKIKQNRVNIKSFGVKKLGLFGSFVRGEQSETSDVDLLVEFERGKKTFDNFMQLSFFLEEIFKLPVELVTTDSLSTYLRPHIVKEVEYVDFTS